jgi:hypothetical protein
MAEREEIPPWLIVLGLGALALIVYEISKGAKAVAGAVGTVTAPLSSAIASTYAALTFGPPVAASGNVADLSGDVLGPISSFPAAHDAQGNTYLQIYGQTYQLGPRDANGNFTAQPVANPSAVPAGGTSPQGATLPAGGTGATSAGLSGFTR